MLAQSLQYWGQQVRDVAIAQDLTVTVDDVAGSWFRVGLARAALATPPAGLPRARKPAKLTTRGIANLSAGDRVDVVDRGTGLTETWEVTSPAREVRTGARLEGYELDVHLVAELYPQRATLEEQGGTELLANVPVAIAPAGELHEGHGRYADFEAEAPIEFFTALSETPRRLHIGDQLLTIATAERVLEPPFVRMRLRGRA